MEVKVLCTIVAILSQIYTTAALCCSVAELEVTMNDHSPTLHELRHFPVKGGYKDLVAEIKNDYQIFGTLLLKDENGNIVAGIEKAKQGNPQDITVEVLHQWLQEKGRMPVTWETLGKCLQEAKLNAVAGYIDQQHSSTGPEKQPISGPSIQENGGTIGIRKINKQKIEVKFASLLRNVRKKLREKQINPEELRFLANSIFLREYIPKSSSINEIFEAMNRNRLWDYWNYYLLEEFILHFATDDPDTKAMMESYRLDLESYKVTKKIIDHIDNFNETTEQEGQLKQLARYDQQCYQKLSLKIKMNFTDHSLKYIDDLWNRFANLYSLPPHDALLDHIQKGCISIVWLIPPHLAPQIFYAAPPLRGDFYHKHEITRVELNGKCIYDEEEDCHKVHCVHIDKERDEGLVAAESQAITSVVIAIVTGSVVILLVKKCTGVVPHPADPNVRENVPHARHLEPEASKECIYQEEKEHCKKELIRVQEKMKEEHKKELRVLKENENLKLALQTLKETHEREVQALKEEVKKILERTRKRSHRRRRFSLQDEGVPERSPALPGSIASGATEYPLHVAAKQGNLAEVKHLVDEGARINIKDNNEMTPLHVAVKKARTEIVKFLVDREADINIKDANGMTPLHLAAERGRCEEILGYLIAKGGVTSINITDEEGRTPLHVAVREGQECIVKFLVDSGADLTIKDNCGMTPFHAAAERGRCEEILGYLHANGDDSSINIKDEDGRTPLHIAVEEGQECTVETLVEKYGADINNKDNDGMTPLHVAVERGDRINIMKYLLNEGAAIDVTDKHERTPIHIAAREGHEYSVRTLVKRGADTSIKDKDGMTPWDVADESGHVNITKFLREQGRSPENIPEKY